MGNWRIAIFGIVQLRNCTSIRSQDTMSTLLLLLLVQSNHAIRHEVRHIVRKLPENKDERRALCLDPLTS